MSSVNRENSLFSFVEGLCSGHSEPLSWLSSPFQCPLKSRTSSYWLLSLLSAHRLRSDWLFCKRSDWLSILLPATLFTWLSFLDCRHILYHNVYLYAVAWFSRCRVPSDWLSFLLWSKFAIWFKLSNTVPNLSVQSIFSCAENNDLRRCGEILRFNSGNAILPRHDAQYQINNIATIGEH